jgi:hypothetical protein
MAHADDVRWPGGDEPGADPARVHAAAAGGARCHLARCWGRDCDIDPLILRVRLLRGRGARHLAVCLEQELLPLF